MRAKSVLLLVIALGCGVVASVAVSQVVLDQKNRVVQTVPVLVVAKEISAATKVSADSFRLEQWPMDRVPLGAISDPKLIENKFTKQRLYPGEPFIEAKLSGKGRDFTVPEGYRTFDIAVKDETGGGGYIGPGDHVDVYGYFEKGARVKAAKSVKVMENLEVVMIDGNAIIDAESTKQKKSQTIQLLVKDSQYVVLDTASNLGRLRLALRPPAQVAAKGTQTDDGEKFLAWLKESDAVPVEKTVSESVNTAPAIVQPEKTEKHEMVIVSPSKSTLYRWTKDQMMPQKIDTERLEEPSSTSGVQSQSQSAAVSTPRQSPRSQAQSSNASSTANTFQPHQTMVANPENGPPPVAPWDPSNGNWQSGGFKATYPTSQ